MFNFFAKFDSRIGDNYIIDGQDFNHIKNVLRMKEGDELLVSFGGVSHLCEIESFSDSSATVKITHENYQITELPIKIYLFQALPKADKMELIIQKCVELGVHSVIPVEMSRCVVKLDDKKKKSKVQRWQSISESAAKQSKRSIVPEIHDVVNLNEALQKAQELDLFLVPYENARGMGSTKDALSKIKTGMNIGILIGPEGGFDEKEAELSFQNGGISLSLGTRILRTETAAITAVAMCMLYCEMNLGGEEE